MAVSASVTAAFAIDVRARELRDCATRRWLVKDELVFLLRHHKQQSVVPCLQALQPRPPSGTLLFYDTTAVADFKKDGWRWQKRKDNSGRVREDRAKLVINRDVIILGTYVHSAEIPTFHRRNYYLRDADQQLMLVHYFDEVHKFHPSMGALVPPKTQPLPQVIPSIIPMVLSSTQPPIKGLKRMLPPSSSSALKMDPSFDSSRSVDVIMTECFAMDYHDQAFYRETVEGSSQPFPSFDEDEALLSDLTSLLPPVASAASSHDIAGTTSSLPPAPLVEISDFSPGWDFVEGGAKILLCLATPLPAVDGSQEADKLFVQFGAHTRSPGERISDTVLRCAAPRASCAGRVELFVCRCASADSSDYLQLSTTGRFEYRSIMTSPAPAPTAADEDVRLQVDSLPEIQTNGISAGGKRGRSPGPGARIPQPSHATSRPPDGRRWSNPDCSNLSAFVDTDLDERQCKIRVVERLAEFHDAIRTTSTSSLQVTHSEPKPSTAVGYVPLIQPDSADAATLDSATESAALDDGAIEALSDRDLESLSEQLIENVVRQLVTVAHTSEELLDELNSLDETGLSLLHYVSFYNYAHLIPLLLSHGAQVNQQSTQGQTPLHLAAGCAYTQVIDKLLDAGADLFALDFDGFTPAERADKSGHIEVAQRLRKCMGESTVLEGSWEAEMATSGMWENSMREMDIDGDNGGSNSLPSSQERFSFTPESAGVDAEVDGDPSNHASPSTSRATSYVGENQEHNRKLLLGAFSTMSLHDKCALSLSISRDLASSAHTNAKRRGSSFSDEALRTAGSSSASSPCKGPMELRSGSGSNSVAGGESESIRDTDVKSVIADDEENLNKLEAAMELMGPEEIQSLEEEARVIQFNVRAWLLRRNCRNMRETTKRLHEAAKNIEDQQKQQHDELRLQGVEHQHHHHFPQQQALSERVRAAVTVQAAARTMLARKSFLQTRNVTIKVQAATRGVLCRKNFARMKTHALASLVIQRNVREWLSKHPVGATDSPSLMMSHHHTSPVMMTADLFPTSCQEAKDFDLNEEDAALVRELNAALESPSLSSFISP